MKLLLFLGCTFASISAQYYQNCDPVSVDNGYIYPIPRETLSVDDTYTIWCNSGYEMSGHYEVTCLACDTCGYSGELSELPSCDLPHCKMPTIPNGRVSPSSATIAVGSSYFVECDDDFSLIGNNEVNCTEHNQLSELPTCVQDDCFLENKDLWGGDIRSFYAGNDNINACKDACLDEKQCVAFSYFTQGRHSGMCYIKHSGHNPLSYRYGITSAVMSCFYNTTESCDQVLTVDNGYGSPPYPREILSVGDTYTIFCNSGYELSGHYEVTCGNGGELSDLPFCDLPHCKMPTIPNGRVSPSSATIAVGSSYFVECDDDFTLIGNYEVGCNEHNQLSELPYCAQVQSRDDEWDWCRFKDSFSYKYSTRVYAFGSFSEAQEQCAVTSDCDGTIRVPGRDPYNMNNGRYPLVKGYTLRNRQNPSWVSCHIESETSPGGVQEWCTFKDSFLYEYSSGVYTYEKLSEAQEQCGLRSDCGGITQEPYNNDRFTLRKGPPLQNGESPSGETSWVICDIESKTSPAEQDWCRFDDSFLYDFSSGRYSFRKLSKALKQCSRRTDCGGITQEPYKDGRFTLRKGPALQNGQSPSGETAWLACSAQEKSLTVGGVQDWCTFKDSFLYEYSSGVYTYKKLSEAQEQCDLRIDCGGITQEPYSNDRFTLRKGPPLQNRESPSGEISWVLCDRPPKIDSKGGDYWCRFSDSFLYDYSTGIFTFDKLSEAQEECGIRSDCGGVTKEPYNDDRYTLRKGPALNNGLSPTGETSWVICE